MRHAILPRMSSYRVMHNDYMRTHVHTLNTIYDHMCPCNPQLTMYYHYQVLLRTTGLCTAYSVFPCICLSICTVSHACIWCICHKKRQTTPHGVPNSKLYDGGGCRLPGHRTVFFQCASFPRACSVLD